MKTKKNILALGAAGLMLVTGSVFGTMAYLTSTDEVANAFTVGSVALTLDEAKVDTDGTPVEGAERVQENTYHLLPGHSYTKDPTVHFAAGSEDSWLFVKIENGISLIESKAEDYTSIAKQITNNGWTALDDTGTIYYREADGTETPADYPVFAGFTIDGTTDGEKLSGYINAKVNVTAYAVQKDGFDTAQAAWTATFGAPSAS